MISVQAKLRAFRATWTAKPKRSRRRMRPELLPDLTPPPPRLAFLFNADDTPRFATPDLAWPEPSRPEPVIMATHRPLPGFRDLVANEDQSRAA